MSMRCWLVIALLSVACSDHNKTDAAVADAKVERDVSSAPDSPVSADSLTGPEVLPTVTCEDLLRHQASCGRVPDAEDYATNYCKNLADAQSKWRPDYFAFFFSCLANHDCHMDDDECMISAAQSSGDPVVDMAKLTVCLQAPSQDCALTYYGVAADCEQKHQDCKDDAGHSFSDERCFSIAALNEAGRAKVPTCLALDCSAVSKCLSELGTINP
jgi:hypothetical protein